MGQHQTLGIFVEHQQQYAADLAAAIAAINDRMIRALLSTTNRAAVVDAMNTYVEFETITKSEGALGLANAHGAVRESSVPTTRRS